MNHCWNCGAPTNHEPYCSEQCKKQYESDNEPNTVEAVVERFRAQGYDV